MYLQDIEAILTTLKEHSNQHIREGAGTIHASIQAAIMLRKPGVSVALHAEVLFFPLSVSPLLLLVCAQALTTTCWSTMQPRA